MRSFCIEILHTFVYCNLVSFPRPPFEAEHSFVVSKMEKEERSKKTIVFFVSKESTLAGGDHPESVLILDDKLIRSALEKSGYSVEIKLWDENDKTAGESVGGSSSSQELFSNPLCVVRSVWNWVECYTEFRQFLQRGIDITPCLPLRGDFEGVKLCSYKKYLPQFGELLSESQETKLIPIVPTVFVEQKKGASLKRLKMIAAARGWSEVVLKPAVGGRGDGVERIDFRREVPSDVSKYFDEQLEIADHLLQPFLPEVMKQGEKCLTFIGGDFAHAVRKIPEGWRDEAISQGQKPKSEKVSASKPIDTSHGGSAEEMHDDYKQNKKLDITTQFNQGGFYGPERNLKFRAVHDYFAHMKAGKKDKFKLPRFSWEGEIRAYNEHMLLVGKQAKLLPALFTEIIGQAAVFGYTGLAAA